MKWLWLLLVLGACDRGSRERAQQLTGGDVDRGAHALRQRGCGSCHSIPGIAAADGLVGPPLKSMALRLYVGGHLPNTPENLVRWIQHPREVSQGTAMPDLGVPDEEARDIAAYLYTLK